MLIVSLLSLSSSSSESKWTLSSFAADACFMLNSPDTTLIYPLCLSEPFSECYSLFLRYPLLFDSSIWVICMFWVLGKLASVTPSTNLLRTGLIGLEIKRGGSKDRFSGASAQIFSIFLVLIWRRSIICLSSCCSSWRFCIFFLTRSWAACILCWYCCLTCMFFCTRSIDLISFEPPLA